MPRQRRMGTRACPPEIRPAVKMRSRSLCGDFRDRAYAHALRRQYIISNVRSALVSGEVSIRAQSSASKNPYSRTRPHETVRIAPPAKVQE